MSFNHIFLLLLECFILFPPSLPKVSTAAFDLSNATKLSLTSATTTSLPFPLPGEHGKIFFWKKRRLCKHNPRACKRFSSHHSCCFKRYCVNIYANPSHCGSCGHVCKYGKRCCDGACVDTMKDTRHCGSCGRHCPQGEICVFGMCGYG